MTINIDHLLNTQNTTEFPIDSTIKSNIGGRFGVRPPAHTFYMNGMDDSAILYFQAPLWQELWNKRSYNSNEKKFLVLGRELDEKNIVFPLTLRETEGSSVSVTSLDRTLDLVEALIELDPKISFAFGHSHPINGASSGDLTEMRNLYNTDHAFRNFIIVTPQNIEVYRVNPYTIDNISKTVLARVLVPSPRTNNLFNEQRQCILKHMNYALHNLKTRGKI